MHKTLNALIHYLKHRNGSIKVNASLAVFVNIRTFALGRFAYRDDPSVPLLLL